MKTSIIVLLVLACTMTVLAQYGGYYGRPYYGGGYNRGYYRRPYYGGGYNNGYYRRPYYGGGGYYRRPSYGYGYGYGYNNYYG